MSYTLVANHIPVNATIIGADEHESHYVFDLLFNNSTEIQPDMHSTDTHGANEVNFALLHVFGYQLRRGTGISTIRSGHRSMASGTRASMRTWCSSPFAKSTRG